MPPCPCEENDLMLFLLMKTEVNLGRKQKKRRLKLLKVTQETGNKMRNVAVSLLLLLLLFHLFFYPVLFVYLLKCAKLYLNSYVKESEKSFSSPFSLFC